MKTGKDWNGVDVKAGDPVWCRLGPSAWKAANVTHVGTAERGNGPVDSFGVRWNLSGAPAVESFLSWQVEYRFSGS